jgi:hypothetical protein
MLSSVVVKSVQAVVCIECRAVCDCSYKLHGTQHICRSKHEIF